MASGVPDVCSTVQAMKKGYVLAKLHKYSVIAGTSTKEALGYTVNCDN